MTPKKLVWFQHMHKVAGTNVVGMAAVSGARFHDRHNNGNPVFTVEELKTKTVNGKPLQLRSDGGIEIPFYDYTQEKLDEFIDHEIATEVDFISSEWRYPFQMKHRPDVFYLTCFRDPWERHVSNFNFDKWLYPKKYDTYEKWSTDVKGKPFANNNYFTRILSGVSEYYLGPMTQQHFEEAWSNLNKFDCVLIIDQPNPMLDFELATGWVNDGKTRRKAANRKQYPDESVKQQFIQDNQFDYQLYETAKQMKSDFGLSRVEIFLHQYLSGTTMNKMWWKALEFYQANKDNDKEIAVALLYAVLKRTNRGLLDRIDPALTEFVQPHNQLYTPMSSVVLEKTLLMDIIYRLSHEAYYTSQPEVGLACCRALLNTKISHGYSTDHLRDNLKFYQ